MVRADLFGVVNDRVGGKHVHRFRVEQMSAKDDVRAVVRDFVHVELKGQVQCVKPIHQRFGEFDERSAVEVV
jgi:hypothetical protein